MTPDEFRVKLKEWESFGRVTPKLFIDYIEELEKKVEELEKKSNKKKTVYTVRHIYQHDMDVEHRKVYSGTDPKKAFEYCYSQFQWVKDTCDEYRYPFDEDFEKKFPKQDWYDTHFTGLQIKQFFIDYIRDAIKNKKSITYDFQYNNQWDPDDEGEAGGFELDITEV